MYNSSILDILILILILGFIGTLNVSNLSTIQSLGLLSALGWIILFIVRLIKQGKTPAQKTAGTKPVKAKRNKK